MSEFGTNFAEANQATLRDMLEMGEELAIFHLPSVVVSGNPQVEGVRDIKTKINTISSDLREPNIAESMNAETEKTIGIGAIIMSAATATMSLISKEIERLPFDRQLPLSPQQEIQANGIAELATQKVHSCNGVYMKYSFEDLETEDNTTITITTIQLRDSEGISLARELTMSLQDKFITRSLHISELPTSLHGESEIDVKRTIVPTRDENLRSAAKFFADNDDVDSSSILFEAFNAELMGRGVDGIDELRTRYKSRGKSEELEVIITQMKSRALSVKAGHELDLLNPDFSLPNATELHEYKDILSRIRS